MATFQVPLRVNVPSRATIAVEADSLEEACMSVQAGIDQNAFLFLPPGNDFVDYWKDAVGLAVDDVFLPDGTLCSSPTNA